MNHFIHFIPKVEISVHVCDECDNHTASFFFCLDCRREEDLRLWVTVNKVRGHLNASSSNLYALLIKKVGVKIYSGSFSVHEECGLRESLGFFSVKFIS